jgi:hypothetical protein
LMCVFESFKQLAAIVVCVRDQLQLLPVDV